MSRRRPWRGGRRAGVAAAAALRTRRRGRCGQGGRAARGQAGGRAARGRYLSGPAAPRSVARQTLPRHRSAPRSSPRHPSRRATMHGAAQAFRHAMQIGAAKSVSFEKKTVFDLKIVYKKC